MRERFLHRVYRHSPVNRTVLKNPVKESADPVTYFRSNENREIPIYNGYRYSLTTGLTYIPEIELLRKLSLKGALDKDGTAFYNSVVGLRTLSRPIEDIKSYLHGKTDRFKNHLIKESVGMGGVPIVYEGDRELKEKICTFVGWHTTTLEHVKQWTDIKIHPGMKILEVGYSSGGHSLFALERLGFNVVGIDNAYGGVENKIYSHPYLAKKVGSKVVFVEGDISKSTSLEPQSFDLICSASVLEHIQDLRGCFREMQRLLKPGGCLLHRYNPFFCPNGGHAWSTLDCPWGHVRLSLQDVERYMHELRPHEAQIALPWFRNTLNRMTIAQMQSVLMEEGWRIHLWEEVPERPSHVNKLYPQIFQEIRTHYPGITVADLVSRDIQFVAKII